MIRNVVLRILLAPVSLLYGLGVAIRNLLYELGLLKGVQFDLPVIAVGNISIGGSGKTPHTEYLIRLLKNYINLAVLSRGYKRKTKGYLKVYPDMKVEQVGDEPLQCKRKFPDIAVGVAESRALGIPSLLGDYPQVQTVILDDAFQHRAVTPGLNIMLTEYDYPFFRDFLLPFGRLREWRSAYKRADLIVISKCPQQFTPEGRAHFRKKINLQPEQKLFFSYYRYGEPYYLFNPSYKGIIDEDTSVLLICAIARTDYLLSYLEQEAGGVALMDFEDHHYFTKYDMGRLQTNFKRIESGRKMIITTEKDAIRMEQHHTFLKENDLPVFVLPIEVQFHDDDGQAFQSVVQQFLLDFKV